MSQTGRKPWKSEPFTPQTDEQRAAREKIFYIGLLAVLMFGILTIQLARMQLVHGDEYRARADTNRLRQEVVLPSRGLIYDRFGVPVVENVPSFAAAVVAADVPESREVEIAIALQEIIGEPGGEILALVQQRRGSNDPFTPAVLKENLSEDVAFALREKLADLPGVRVVIEPQRRYLEGELLGHILGFVGPVYAEDYETLAAHGYQFNDRVGKAGVELTYESFLRGAPGTRAVETDASGREIKVLAGQPPDPGLNLVLSIDLDLQRKVQEILLETMGESLNAAGIVIDVRTGELLALVSVPTYDSNIFSGEIDMAALQALIDHPGKPMLNHTISEMYRPGSTFKIITGMGALQEGVANAGTQIFSPGYLLVENEYLPGVFDRFVDWRSDLGTMNFYRGIAMSSNVYSYYLAGGYVENGRQVFRGLGAQRLADWARNFGLGEPTGIDLPGETPGVVPDPQWKEELLGEGWLLGDTYNFGIGQGYVSATPLQMVLVTAAIANGGNLLIPHVVKEARDAEGNTVQIVRETVKWNLNLDPRNLGVMREAMRQAVADGSAFTAAISNVTIAGKTGTAEFGERRSDGGYQEHGWFTGYGPFNDPEIAVIVFHQRGNGAGTAAPAAARILDYYFNERNLVQADNR